MTEAQAIVVKWAAFFGVGLVYACCALAWLISFFKYPPPRKTSR